MAIPLDAAIELLDKKRDALLEEKHQHQEFIAQSEEHIRALNIELASISAAMNLLDNRNGVPVTKEEIYGEKDS